MGFAILPHTEIVNYTKGLMLLHVPRTLALCFMMTTVKTRSVLKLSWSSPPLLQFYLSCPFKEGTKGMQQVVHFTCQPVLSASDKCLSHTDMKLLSSLLFVEGDNFLKEIQEQSDQS